MSITAHINGGLELSDPISLSGLSIQEILTSTDKDTIIATISVVNEGASAAKITLFRYDGAADKAIWHQVMAPDTTEIIKDIPIRLYAGEALRARSDQASGITITPIVIRTGSYEAHNHPAAGR